MPKIEKTDSQITVSLENGPEVFTASDPLEMTNQLSKSLDEGKKWGKDGWAKAEQNEAKARQYEAELQALKQQQAQAQQQTQTYDEHQLVEYGKFAEEARARVRGYKNKEALWDFEQGVINKVELQNDRAMAQQFHAAHPDFPDTPHAIEAMGKTIDEFASGKWNEKTMAAAHALLIYEHSQDPTKGYAPLTPEQIAAARGDIAQVSRQAPPPMIHGGNPELTTQANDPYSMSMAELRKAALAQEMAKR